MTSGATPADPRCASHYERLRTWAITSPRPVQRPPGLVLVLRYGVPAWLTACATWLPAVAALTAPGPGPAGRAPPVAVPDIAVVLAAMVAHTQEEVPP